MNRLNKIASYGKLWFGKYYIGQFRGEDVVHESVWGFVKSGYWYAGGQEKQPYNHTFWGFVWGNANFGVGKIEPTEDWAYEEIL